MTTISFPTTKTVKDSIRDAIGISVVFVLNSGYAACPVCSGADLYDEVNEVSLSAFCPTCSGDYWTITNQSISSTGHVRWISQDEKEFGVSGQTYAGECTITIDIDDLTAAQITKIRYVVVDGRNVMVQRSTMKGVPTRDRIKFVCKEWSIV